MDAKVFVQSIELRIIFKRTSDQITLKTQFFDKKSGTRVLAWITRVLQLGDFPGISGSGSTREASLARTPEGARHPEEPKKF